MPDASRAFLYYLNIAYTHVSVVLVIFRYYLLQNKQSNRYGMTSVVGLFACISKDIKKFKVQKIQNSFEVQNSKFKKFKVQSSKFKVQKIQSSFEVQRIASRVLFRCLKEVL